MTTFAGGQFSHNGITSGCDSCHGPNITNSTFYGITKIVVMPATSPVGVNSHLPTSTKCESCHLGSTPTKLVPGVATKTAPGSDFKTPAPTPSMIHAGVSSGCSSCHDTNNVWMSMEPYPITTSAPYKGFQTRPQTSAGLYFVADAKHPKTGDCSNCHGNTVEFGAPSLPSIHIPTAASATCSSCHGDFSSLPTVTNIHAYAPSTSANCAQCHSSTNAAKYNQNTQVAIVATPPKHIGMGTLGCESCHVGANSSLKTTPVVDGDKFSNSAFSHSGITSGCASCHGATVTTGTFAGVLPKTIANLSPVHVPTTAACESCHTNSIPSTLIPLSGASGSMTTFAGGQFSHSGITSGCDSCHGSNITGSSFYGIKNIVVLPPVSPAGMSSHIPSANNSKCESCHLASTPSVLVPATATKTVPGTAFQTPVTTGAMIHAGVTSNCASCHEAGYSWLGVNLYTRSPTTLTTGANYIGFNARPTAGGGTYSIKDANHPTTGDCSNCHASTTSFSVAAMPANHIPTATGASCTSCHTNIDFSVMPTMENIHAYAPSSTTNCAQCHGSAAASFAIPSANFAIVSTPSNHVGMGALGCESCHVGANSSLILPVKTGAKFSNSAFSHSGITNKCDSCHGANVTTGTFAGITPKTSNLTPVHVPVPTTAACESCHVNSIPSTLIPLSGASGSMTTFAGGQFSHSGITNKCDSCHGSNITVSSFYGITKIVVLPPVSPAGLGSHIPVPSNINKCEACHLGSTPTALVPGNYTKNAPGSMFLLPAPTSAAIHTGVTSGCTACHEAGNLWMSVNQYPITTSAPFKGFQTRPQSSAITAFTHVDASHPTSGDCSNCHSTLDFTTTTAPTNHIPTATSSTCASCHTNADFSKMPTLDNIHKYAPSSSTNCAQCHSTANAAKYFMASMSPAIVAPDAKHVPFGTTACEVCHVGTGSSLQLPVTASSKFTKSMFSHSGITTNCVACHGSNINGNSFTGITSIVVIPPMTTQGATSHIPSTTTCESCHLASTPSGLVAASSTKTAPGTLFKAPAPTGAMIHAGITSGCSGCHEKNYLWMGVDQYPISPKVVTANASYKGFQTRPYATSGTYSVADAAHPATGDCSQCHSSTTAFSAAGKPAGHIVTSVPACTTCHLVAGDYSYATGKLAALPILHTGITTGCISCHTAGTGAGPFAGCATQAALACTSPPPITYQPKMMPLAAGGSPTAPSASTHVPVPGIACEKCHLSNTSFSGMNMNANAPHLAVSSLKCMSCHEGGYVWYGVPNIKTRWDKSKNHEVGKDCGSSGCHGIPGGKGKGMEALLRPIMRNALVNPELGRLLPNLQTIQPGRGTLGTNFDHQGVEAGKCKTCHDGQRASGMPARHLMVTVSCDTCHRTTAWQPASFDHSGVAANTCLVCHNGMAASGKPSGHFMSARSCGSCHESVAWQPVRYLHISPTYKALPDKLTCVSCHTSNSEIIVRQMRALPRPKPIPVGP
jgi:hypothetical protein